MARRSRSDVMRQKTSAERTLEQAEQLELVARWSPIFRLFGERGRLLAETLSDAPRLAAEALELITLPARFNAVLGRRGWIAYERLNEKVLKRATELAEAGELDAAEEVLVNAMDEKTVRQQLVWMLHINAFKPRRHLLWLAVDDYAAGRYHACVPVVLAQLDGFVADVAGSPLFERTKQILKKLIAFDSISAAEGGLPALTQLLAESRRTTTTQELDVPYRHGILHGRDLGYANKKVAAKCWAALFSTGDWAGKFERGQLEAPPFEAPPSLLQLLGQLVETQREGQAIEAWRGREPFKPDDTADLPPDTPEFAVKEELTAWPRADNVLYAPWLGEQPINSFRLLEVRDKAAAVTDVTVEVSFEDQTIGVYLAVASYVDGRGRFVLRGTAGGIWRVAFRHMPARAIDR